jgi:hypothetical protein
MKPNAQRGVALVITLIMLAVVTFMATAFLTLSRRERGAVKTTTDQTTAGLMAQMASDHAIAQTVGSILARSNLFLYDLMVSTNFINPAGFRSGLVHPTNVSYYRPDGSPITNNISDMLVNLGNLQYLPRPPVYYPQVNSNNVFVGNDFRFFYNLNRNNANIGTIDDPVYIAIFEETGSLMVTNNLNRPAGISNTFVGDPQWIGVLERVDSPHSPSNRFIGRYAFITLPAGKTLDLNYVHNQAKSQLRSPSAKNARTFSRNQGVGAWEINLGAFFRDLNTNIWRTYSYNPAPDQLNGADGEFAFEDAYWLIRYRANELNNPANSIQEIFKPNASRLQQDGIDLYSDGPMMTNTAALPAADGDNLSLFWPGSDNNTNYYDVQQLLAMPIQLPDLGPRLQGVTNLATRRSSYDRYTYYRLLSQLGVDSKPAWNNKIHINYRNDYDGTIQYSPTNLVRWTPAAFFNNAADRMLRSQFNLSLTNIPIYPYTNQHYNAAIHRLLQLAANIYDATTNSGGYTDPLLPSVFRPIFGKTSSATNIFIVGYTNEVTDGFLRRPWRDLNLVADRSALQPNDNVYGVPVIIGARKGYPNFNESSMQTVLELTRKVELRKRIPGGPIIATNQMYILGISNLFGIEGWNSYAKNFTRPLELRLTNWVSMALVNSNGIMWPANRQPLVRLFSVQDSARVNLNSWPSNEFKVHLMTNVIFLTNSIYTGPNGFQPLIPVQYQLQGDLLNITNPIYLTVTNRLQYILIDKGTRRVVDLVNLNQVVNRINLTDALVGNVTAGNLDNIERALWDYRTGLTNQMQISLGNIESQGLWNSYSRDPISGDDKDKAIDRFRAFLGFGPIGTHQRSASEQNMANASLAVQTPFNPTRKLVLDSSLQVNDPLVHYTYEDLLNGQRVNPAVVLKPPNRALPENNLGRMNTEYRPWGGNPGKDASNDPLAYSLAFKDPEIRKSDDWQFPTNVFPNIGWLGRVHRGTPWQTVYLKSEVANKDIWAKQWSVRPEMHPTNDWWLVDLFTTAINENAARGLLSVNQSGLAAWSAVLSGVSVLSNATAKGTSVLIEPASPQIQAIVKDINDTRAAQPAQAFTHLGSILAVKSLTANSPFLRPNVDNITDKIKNDMYYERIPQQILSLLKADEPRLVVYALGQSLRPAPNSLVLEPGNYYKMCTNYEVTAEMATKTVFRIEGPPERPRAVTESYSLLPAE